MISQLYNGITTFYRYTIKWINNWYIGPKRVLFVGLENSGKSTINYRLKQHLNMSLIGFAIETMQYENLNMDIWDVNPIENKLKPLWTSFTKQSDALIFVIDCGSDIGEIDKACELLGTFCDDSNENNIPILIFANKQDLPNALNTSQLMNKLNLNKLKNRKYHIQPCSAISFDGIIQGLGWIKSCFNLK